MTTSASTPMPSKTLLEGTPVKSQPRNSWHNDESWTRECSSNDGKERIQPKKSAARWTPRSTPNGMSLKPERSATKLMAWWQLRRQTGSWWWHHRWWSPRERVRRQCTDRQSGLYHQSHLALSRLSLCCTYNKRKARMQIRRWYDVERADEEQWLCVSK